MSTIILTVDGSSDLPDNLAKEYNIIVLNAYVETDRGEFIDKIEFSAQNVLDYIDYNKKLPVQKNLTAEEYESRFRELLSSDNSILHLAAGSGFSTCWQNAVEAANRLNGETGSVHKRIIVLDSTLISAPYAMLAYKVAKVMNKALKFERLAEYALYTINRTHAFFLQSSPELLGHYNKHKPGIKLPVTYQNSQTGISIIGGEWMPEKKFRGDPESSCKSYIKYQMSNCKDFSTEDIFLTFSGYDHTFIVDCIAHILSYAHFKNVIICDTSSNVAIHGGPHFFCMAFSSL